MLKCGHSCVGLCGELCPTLCRTCDKGKLTEFQLLGNEEEDGARYIYCISINCISYDQMVNYLLIYFK